MRCAVETQSSTLAHGTATGWISDRNLVQPVASSPLISGVECAPTSPHQATRHHPSDPWDPFFFAHRCNPLGFALTCCAHIHQAPASSAVSSDECPTFLVGNTSIKSNCGLLKRSFSVLNPLTGPYVFICFLTRPRAHLKKSLKVIGRVEWLNLLAACVSSALGVAVLRMQTETRGSLATT